MIYRLVREGLFPAFCKPGGAATRWSLREVRAWRDEQLAKRDDPQPSASSIDVQKAGSNQIELTRVDAIAPKSVLTPADLAERWHTTVATVYAAIKKGELRAFQLGPKLFRVRLEAAEEYEQRFSR
jgi:excisionase family DNA binding protein